MIEQQLQHFFAMGGYGIYVWPAYGITIAVLIMNILQPLLQHRQILQQKIAQSSQINCRNTHVINS